jgi:hypothetical protein
MATLRSPPAHQMLKNSQLRMIDGFDALGPGIRAIPAYMAQFDSVETKIQNSSVIWKSHCVSQADTDSSVSSS